MEDLISALVLGFQSVNTYALQVMSPTVQFGLAIFAVLFVCKTAIKIFLSIAGQYQYGDKDFYK